MHALKLVIALSITAMVTATAQTGPDERDQIRLRLDGAIIEGAQERAARLLGKAPAEQSAIIAEPLPELINGQSVQLSVAVTNPNGQLTTYTTGKRITYEHFGCLTITNSYLMVVAPSGRCNGSDLPALWVVFNDVNGKPIAYNEYLFRVKP